MLTIIIILSIYLSILAGLAIWSRHETKNLSGYYLAGKKLPFWVVAFSTNATGESGWLLLGLSGVGYAIGFQAYWIVIGEVLGLVAAWWIVARRLKKFSDRSDAITIPDVLANNFKDKSKFVPEGVEGRVEYKGKVSKIIYQLQGGLRSSMGYVGAKSLKEINKRAKFVKITKAGFYESMVHSVEVTQKSNNYKL